MTCESKEPRLKISDIPKHSLFWGVFFLVKHRRIVIHNCSETISDIEEGERIMRTVGGQKTLYTECQNKVVRLQNVLEAVLVNGIPVSQACKRENINYLWFMRFVKQNIDASKNREKDRVTVTQKDWETWREDFLRDLTRKETVVPADFDEVYAQIIMELDDVEREVLQLRYQEGLSLREIAEHKHLSSERIRQILAKTMCKLRHPRYRWQLCLGTGYNQALEKLHSAQAEYDRAVASKELEVQDLLNEKIKELSKEAEGIRAETECVLVDTKKLRENPGNTNLYEALAEKRRKTTLEELGLSVRPYNALYRYFACNHLEKNAESVASLHGRLDLVRGIGRNSEKEIVAVMKQFGINMAE